jgi:hypothetical protein
MDRARTRRGTLATLAAAIAVSGFAAACAPTIHVKVDPITIYAKLDADVRIRLDDDVKALIQANPDLF